MPPEAMDDDAIRQRLFELMPRYPSKDACKMHLCREGFPGDAVERVVDETFAIRKKVVMRRMTDEVDLTRILVSVLDGETALPNDVGKLKPIAREYSKRLSRDSRSLLTILRGYAVIVLLVVLCAVFFPQPLVLIVAVSLRRPWIGAAVVAVVLGALGNAINSVVRLRLTRDRAAALRDIATREDWELSA